MNSFRWLSLVLAVTMLLTGSLPLAVRAQQPQQPAQEAPQAPEEQAKGPGAGYALGAVVVNVIHIPGKLALCTIGGVLGLATLGITIGSGYRAAARIMEEGCGRPWVITPQDLKGDSYDHPERMY